MLETRDAQIKVPALCRETAAALPDPAPSSDAPDPGPFPAGSDKDPAVLRAIAMWWKAASQYWKVDSIYARAAHADLLIDKNACAEGLAGQ